MTALLYTFNDNGILRFLSFTITCFYFYRCPSFHHRTQIPPDDHGALFPAAVSQ